jgi:hypothetical protein
MAAPTRCALFVGHVPPCATWPHLRDDALPKTGTRCTRQVEPRVEHWQVPITEREMRDEEMRRYLVRRARHHAVRFGCRGRIRFVRLDVIGPRDTVLYAIRVLPATPDRRMTA